MQMNYWYASDKNFCKLAKRAEITRNYQKQVLVMIKHCLAISQINSTGVNSFLTELCRTNAKVTRITSRRADFIHSAKLKKFSTLKNTPFLLNPSIKVHRRALLLPLCLLSCHCREKVSKRISQHSPFRHHFIAQRDNIHGRAQDTCVDQRGYMTSGWCNLF